MFNVTEIHTRAGYVVVEDIEMGLIYRFTMPKVMVAKINNDYELEMVNISGQVKKVRILD